MSRLTWDIGQIEVCTFSASFLRILTSKPFYLTSLLVSLLFENRGTAILSTFYSSMMLPFPKYPFFAEPTWTGPKFPLFFQLQGSPQSGAEGICVLLSRNLAARMQHHQYQPLAFLISPDGPKPPHFGGDWLGFVPQCWLMIRRPTLDMSGCGIRAGPAFSPIFHLSRDLL